MADWLVIQVEQPGGEPGAAHSPVSGATVCLVARADVKDEHYPFEKLAATHAEAEPGVYRGALPANPEGEFLLVVRKKDASTVVQRLRVSFSKAVKKHVATPGWSKVRVKRADKPGYDDLGEPGSPAAMTAATVSLPRYNHSRSANNDADRVPIKVLLHEATEIVFMATSDYRNVRETQTKNTPLDYRQFANGRRNRLYLRRGKLESRYKVPSKAAKNFDESAYEEVGNGVNPGTIYTLFWCHDRTRTTMVKSQEGDSGNWIIVDSIERPAPADADPNEKYFKNPKRPSRVVPAGTDPKTTVGETHEWSITDLYKYVSDIGAKAPQSVVELGIFGHGWYAGPLVWSTDDASPSFLDRWEGGTSDVFGDNRIFERDLDGRQKDWFLPARDAWPNLIDAFHPQASFRVWGCNHMVNVLQEGRTAFDKLEAGLADDVIYEFPLVQEVVGEVRGTVGNFPVDLGRESATLRHIAKNFEFYFKSVRNEHAVEMGDARGVAAYCGVAAGFLGVPTFGSPPGSGASYVDNRNMAVEAFGAEKCIKFMKAVFGKAYQESTDGYVDYRSVFDGVNNLPDPGWNTRRWARYRADFRGEIFEATQKRFVQPFVLRVASGLEVFRRPGDFDIGDNPGPAQFNKGLADAFPSPKAFELDGETGHLFRTPLAKPVRFELRTHAGEETWERRALILNKSADGDVGIFVTESGKILLLRAQPGKDDWAPDGIGMVPSRWAGGITRWKVSGPPGPPSALLEKVTPKYFW